MIGVLLCLVVPACGGDGGGGNAKTKAGAVTPKPLSPGRFQVPEYAFTTRAGAARTEVTVDGKRLSGRGQLLVVVRVRLGNRQRRRLVVGQMNADLRASHKRYAPILADGREATEPIFAETTVPSGRSISSRLVYRVPRRALKGARLAVSDPKRHQAFQLALF